MSSNSNHVAIAEKARIKNDAMLLWNKQLSTAVNIHISLVPYAVSGAQEESTSPTWLAAPAMNAWHI